MKTNTIYEKCPKKKSRENRKANYPVNASNSLNC